MLNDRPPVIGDTARYLINAILIVMLIGAVVALAYGVGWWMMSLWHQS